jgi:hypothetical protein
VEGMLQGSRTTVRAKPIDVPWLACAEETWQAPAIANATARAELRTSSVASRRWLLAMALHHHMDKVCP